MRFVLAMAMILMAPAWGFAQTPTCEEQVALLQGYVTELVNQRGALESRLIITQTTLKKIQEAPPAHPQPDVKARTDQR